MRWIPCIVWVLIIGGIATGQTSRPATPHQMPATWESTVRALGEALVSTSDRDAMADVLTPGTAIRCFDRLDPEDRLSLHAATSGGLIVAAFGYTSIPTTIASDLSSALEDADYVPQATRDEFALEDAKRIKEANETATQWVTTTLQPGVEQPVGLLLLWQQRAPESGSEQPTGELVFVLVKAHETAPGEFRIDQIIYGHTNQIIR